MVSTTELLDFCSSTLDAQHFHDAAINGLQVEGTKTIRRVAVAVSVSERIIREAVGWKADMLLVHHGLFWGERTGPIAGPLKNRLRLLLAADMNLAGYHLPLDGHPEIGNNALLIRELGLQTKQPFAEIADRAIGFVASPPAPIGLDVLAGRVEALTKRAPTVLPGTPDLIELVAVVSGSGYSALDEAAELGCQALITGDVREPTMAMARELGVSVIAGGHEATERLGVQSLAALLADRFEVETRFFNDPNPI